MQRHRNSQKRIYIQGAVYFITMVTYGRYPYFENEIFCELFVHELAFCSEIKSCAIYGYAVMPDHVHLLIRPTGRWNYSEIIGSLKRNYSRDCNYVMGFNDSPRRRGFESAPSGHDESAHSRYDESADSRYDGSASSGDDVNKIIVNNAVIQSYKNRFGSECANSRIRNRFPPFKWQKSYHDHFIRNENDFYNHIMYIARQREHHGCGGVVWVCGDAT